MVAAIILPFDSAGAIVPASGDAVRESLGAQTLALREARVLRAVIILPGPGADGVTPREGIDILRADEHPLPVAAALDLLSSAHPAGVLVAPFGAPDLRRESIIAMLFAFWTSGKPIIVPGSAAAGDTPFIAAEEYFDEIRSISRPGQVKDFLQKNHEHVYASHTDLVPAGKDKP